MGQAHSRQECLKRLRFSRDCASAAAHRAKRARTGYAINSDSRELEKTRRLPPRDDVHRSIESGELRLYCQPKVDFASRRVWARKPFLVVSELGMFSPTKFIPLAEQAGMIRSLANWMRKHPSSKAVRGLRQD